MLSLHVRHKCRAHNRFSPASVLWHHFVPPTCTHHPQPFSSTPTRGAVPDVGSTSDAQLETDVPRSHVEDGSAAPAQCRDKAREDTPIQSMPKYNHPIASYPPIRRLTTAKGRFAPAKRGLPLAKNLIRTHNMSRDSKSATHYECLELARRAFQAGEDYEAAIVKPFEGPFPQTKSPLAWCISPDESNLSGMHRLAREIDHYYQYTIPTRHEKIARKYLIEQVRKHVREILPEHTLEVFGSERTGLASATSDIDLRLMTNSASGDPTTDRLPPSLRERNKALSELKYLFHRKLSSHSAYLLASLRHARYPLISLLDRQSGVDVQIVLANDHSIARAMMQSYMDEYPYLRQLFFIVKATFNVRGLSDVFRGGFGSYSLFMMIVASIKHASKLPQDMASALIQFLQFYSEFNTQEKGISIEPAYIFDKTSEIVTTSERKSKLEQGKLQPLPPYMLCLRDPADETNDLGRKGIFIKHVQATLRDLLSNLQRDMKSNTCKSLLEPFIGPTEMLDRERRKRLENYGKHLITQIEAQVAKKAGKLQKGRIVEDVIGKGEAEVEVAKERLAMKARDKEIRRLAHAREERLRAEAQLVEVMEQDTMFVPQPDIPFSEKEGGNHVKGSIH